MLLDFYAGCQWNSFAYKMASLALHQNPRKTKEPSKKMAIKSDRWIRRMRKTRNDQSFSTIARCAKA